WFATRNEKRLVLPQNKIKHTHLVVCVRVHYAVSDITPRHQNNCSDDLSVAIAAGKRPVPIPHPEAKPARADGTAPGRVGESKLPPTFKQTKTTYDNDPPRHTRLDGSFRHPYMLYDHRPYEKPAGIQNRPKSLIGAKEIFQRNGPGIFVSIRRLPQST